MAQFTKPSKKATIITVAIIVVLLIIAAAGTVMFLKDRGTTEAADLEQEQVATQSENSDSQTQTGEQATDGQTTPKEQTSTGEVATGEEGTGATQGTATEGTTQSTSTGTQGTTTGTTTGGASTTTENIQASTITRTETIETEPAWERQNLGWTPSGIDADFAKAGLSKLNVQEDDVKIEKEAYTKTGEGLAQVGETITYTIKVTNNSGKDVEVKDRIQTEKVTYVEGSVKNAEVSEDNSVIYGTVGKGEKVEITFNF